MAGDILKSIAKNTSIMYVQQLITWASTFLLMFFLPRYLGPVEYGRYFLAFSIVSIFVLITQYGGNYLVAKNVSRSPGDTGQIMVDGLAFRLVFAVAAYMGIVALVVLVDYPPTVRTLLLVLGLLSLWGGGITVLYACFQGHELMQYTSAGAILERVFIALVGVTVLLLGGGVVLFAAVTVTASFLNFALLAFSSRRIVRSIPSFNGKDIVAQLKDGFPYFLFAIFSTIYYRIDSVMLSRMTPEYVVGWYGGASRLFDALNFFPYVFTVAVFPILSRLWKEEEHAYKRTAQKSLEFMIIVGVLISVTVIFFAGKIIGLFYGLSDYGNSVPVLQILSGGLVFLYIDMVLGTTMMSSDKQSQLSLVSLAMIPLKIILSFVLIQYYQTKNGNGGIGSAVATVATEFCIMVLTLWLVPKGILKGFRLSVLVKSLIAGALMACAVLLSRWLGAPWFVAICIGPIVFALSLFGLRTLEPAEETLLRNAFTVRNLRAFRNLIGRDQPEPL